MATPSDPQRDLAVYVPRLVREWVSDDPSPMSMHRSIEGSMVFADVSGFTKLSERLAKLGKVGAETINEIIDTCFTELIDQAYTFGGTLLQFGGDALLLFFRGDGHQLRASAAALEMRRTIRELREFTWRVGRANLSMTIGVNSGDFDFFLVGGSHRQLIVGGAAVTALVGLEGTAERGQILVGDTTAAALPRQNVGRRIAPGVLLRGPLGTDRLAPAPFLSIDHDMNGLIPVGLRHAVRTGIVQSEHRTATVAFLEYRGLDRVIADAGADEAASRLHALTLGVQAAIDDRDICLQSADLGVDGGKFYLSLGAPRSTGSDEEFMLLALREIIDLDVGLALRAGVNSGSVFTGEIRTKYRSTFLTMGDAVNLAARLMSKAGPGEVFATDAVLDRSRTLFETERLAPFMVKGKSQPVTAHRVGPAGGIRPAIGGSDLPMVGRDAETARFRAALDDAESGAGRYIELTAEPGAGKSKLLDACEQLAAHVSFHRIRCRLYQSTTPYFVIAELLRDLFDLEGTAGTERAAADAEDEAGRLRRAVETTDPELLPWLSLIGAVVGVDIEPSDEVQRLDPEFRKAQLDAAVVQLISAASVEPTVLCFEDTHWMDDASGEVLDALVADVDRRPWVVISAHRSGAAGPTIESRAPDAVIELEPLGPEAMMELIGIAGEAAPVAPHVAAAIIERSGGNPLFLLELLNGVQAGGDLDTMPTSVEGLLTARIDRLGTDDRAMLRHVSVLGAGFAVDYTVDVLPDSARGSPLEAMRRLHEFISVDDTGWAVFRHHLVRDVAYEGLPFRTRRALHRRVAESIVRRVGDDVEDEASLLSLHFSNAQQHREGFRFSRLAGDRARAVYANVEAVSLYRRALASGTHLALPADTRAGIFEDLGDVQELAGMFGDARHSFVTARRLRSGDPIGQARLSLRIAFIDERLGSFVAAVRSIRRGSRTLDGIDGDAAIALRAQFAVWYAAVRLGQGRFAEAVPASEEGIRLAQRVDDAATLARAYLTLDYALSCLGAAPDLSASQRALEIYTEIGDLGGEATAANALGGYAYFAGRWDEAATLYRRSQEARGRMGDPANAALCSANLAEILIEQGKLDDADGILGEVLSVWRASNDSRGVALACRLRGIARARSGDVDSAAELLANARHGFASIGALGELAETDVAIADLHVLEGRFAEAGELLDRVVAEHDAAAFEHLLPMIHRLRGISRFPLDPDGARDDIATALDLARERGADHEVAHALRAVALIRSWSGDSPDQAIAEEHDRIVARLGIRPRREPPRPDQPIRADRAVSGT